MLSSLTDDWFIQQKPRKADMQKDTAMTSSKDCCQIRYCEQ